MPVWHAIRDVSMHRLSGAVRGLFVRPAGRLFASSRSSCRCCPILFFVAPGLWRNICPLAAANQAPRWFGFSLARDAAGLAIARTASSSPSCCSSGSPAPGWRCSTRTARHRNPALGDDHQRVHRLGFVQRQERLVQQHLPAASAAARLRPDAVRHRAPTATASPAWPARRTATTSSRRWRIRRTCTTRIRHGVRRASCSPAALPGFVLGFFTLLSHAGMSHCLMLRTAGALLRSPASALVLCRCEACCRSAVAMVTPIYGAVAINIFYWYGGVTLANSIHTITGVTRPVAALADQGRRAAAHRRLDLRGRTGSNEHSSTRRSRRRAAQLIQLSADGRPRRSSEKTASGRRGRGPVPPGDSCVAAEIGHEPAGSRRTRRAAPRGRLPDGGVRGRPGRRPGRHGVPDRPRRRRSSTPCADWDWRPNTRMACCARLAVRPGHGVADARAGGCHGDGHSDPASTGRSPASSCSATASPA